MLNFGTNFYIEHKKLYKILIMKCAFIDDDTYYLKIFRKILSNYNYLFELDLFDNTEVFLKRLSSVKYDVIFLDIEMPGTNGITIAENLHEENNDAFIVFVTNRSETVFRAFGLNVIGFIVKEKISSQLPYVMEKIESELHQKTCVSIPLQNNTSIRIHQSSVLYCEIVLRKVFLHTAENKVYALKCRTIKEAYSYFDQNTFIFVNRSEFVNVKKIVEWNPKYIVINNINKRIDVSRDRSKDVKKAYLKNARF